MLLPKPTSGFSELRAAFDSEELRFDEPLSRHCTWQIGGPARILIEPKTEEAIYKAVRMANQFDLPWMVIGDGSNLLFDDAGIDGMVIKIGDNLGQFAISGTTVTAESGIWVPQLAKLVARSGLAGMEHTIGIPGRLGGLICMNGGSLRQSISSAIQQVTFIDAKGDRQQIDREECQFSYRTSIFQSQKSIISSCKLQLQPGRWPDLRKTMRAILKDRRTKFPRKLPNCGSVFKSDPETYQQHGTPGRLIEECGLKGRSIGGACISPLHANFIVNTGGASASDVLSLIGEMQYAVRRKFGVRLQTEVKCAKGKAEIASADCCLS